MQEKTVKRKLTKPQLAHALNRLQSLYQTKTAALTNCDYRRSIDWNNKREVDEFVKEYELGQPTWKDIGTYWTTGALSNSFWNSVDKALQKRQKATLGNVQARLQKATTLFCQAQDSLIFSEPPTGPEMTSFLESFGEQLDVVLKK